MPDTQELIRTALQSLTGFFHDCCTAADEHKRKTASLLAYWLRDYVRFLRKEGEARIYKRFQRGDIVKVHLGYRVGSEEGGLHYAVVVSSTDSVKSPTLVVIPLTSVKSQKRVERLRYSEVFLGDELWQKMYEKSQVSPNNALSKELEKMKPASIVIIIAGMYDAYSKWIGYEIDEAKRMGKTIIGIRPWGQRRVPLKVQQAATEMVGWNSSSLIDAIMRY